MNLIMFDKVKEYFIVVLNGRACLAVYITWQIKLNVT